MKTSLPSGVTLDDVLAELRMRDTIRIAAEDRPLREYLGETSRICDSRLEHLSSHDLCRLVQVNLTGLDGPTFKDVRDISDPDVTQAAATVCAIIHRDGIHRVEDGNGGGWHVALATLQAIEHFCDDEPYAHNLVATDLKSTGFLVDRNLVATAGHSPLKRHRPTDYYCVFDFALHGDESEVSAFYTDDQVFAVQSIRGEYLLGDADWALLQLARDVPRTPCRRGSDIEVGAHVYILGHPLGLPMKHVAGEVTSVCPRFFYTDALTFRYNSGSPVMSHDEVIGIHTNNSHVLGYDTRRSCVQWFSFDAFSDTPIASHPARSTEFRLSAIADELAGSVSIRASVVAFIRTGVGAMHSSPHRVDPMATVTLNIVAVTTVWLLTPCIGDIVPCRWIPYSVRPGQRWHIRPTSEAAEVYDIEMIEDSNPGGSS